MLPPAATDFVRHVVLQRHALLYLIGENIDQSAVPRTTTPPVPVAMKRRMTTDRDARKRLGAYEKHAEIGRGTYGTVYFGYHAESRAPVALKKVLGPLTAARHEAAMLAKCRGAAHVVQVRWCNSMSGERGAVSLCCIADACAVFLLLLCVCVCAADWGSLLWLWTWTGV